MSVPTASQILASGTVPSTTTETHAALTDAIRTTVSTNLMQSIQIGASTNMLVVTNAHGPTFVSVNGDWRVNTAAVTAPPSGASGAAQSWLLYADLSAAQTTPVYALAMIPANQTPTQAVYLPLCTVWWDGTQLQTTTIDFSPIMPLLNSSIWKPTELAQGPFNNVAYGQVTATLPNYAPVTVPPGQPLQTFNNLAPVSYYYFTVPMRAFIEFHADILQPVTPHAIVFGIADVISGATTPLGSQFGSVIAYGSDIPAGQQQTISATFITTLGLGAHALQMVAAADVASSGVQFSNCSVSGFFYRA